MVQVMHNKWFHTVREFNWRLIQLNWLVDDRLIWEVEKNIEDCHMRTRAAAARPGPWAWARRTAASGRDFNFATLFLCDKRSYQNKGLIRGVSAGLFLSPLPTLRLSGSAEVSQLLLRIYRELKPSVDRLEHTTYPAVKEFFRSVSCAHTRWKSRASGTFSSRGFTCSGQGWPSRFWGVPSVARLLISVPPCSRRCWWSSSSRRPLHSFQSALYRAGRLLRQSTMSITGASGSAARYNLIKHLVNYFVKIMILLVCVNNMIDMFYLRDNICHVSLVSTMIFFMMIIWLTKHMYDVMNSWLLWSRYFYGLN
jgi:hypothetical protein